MATTLSQVALLRAPDPKAEAELHRTVAEDLARAIRLVRAD
jgi:hypothetical protein